MSAPSCDEGCTHAASAAHATPDDAESERGASACQYHVAWSINPHMRVGSVRPARAAWQHARFVATLERAGATVITLPFVHGAYDSVFAKDSGLVVTRRDGHREALLSHPRHAERRREQRARALAYAARGLTVVHAPLEHLEGGDIVTLPGGAGALLGHGFRSDPRAAWALTRFLGARVTTLELRDPRLYHLDMALTVLRDGTALVCREAFTPAALTALERSPGVREMVPVSLSEALAFGVNMVEIGNSLIMAGNAPRLRAALRARGRQVIEVELDQFHAAGGSAACLVSRAHEVGRAVTSERCSAA